MEKEVYIIRHGRTEYNKLGIWQGSSVDIDLDEEGERQARLFYEAYKHSDFDLIVHSSLIRSKQTVELFKSGNTIFEEVPEINEISWGIYEGKPHTKVSLAEYNRVVAEWGKENYDVGFIGGESANELKIRIERFVDWLKNVKQRKILICSHGRTIRGLLCIMQHEPMKDMEKYDHANTGVFKSVFNGDRFDFSFFNNTDHLNDI